ncbi:MAG: hypothetical protein HFJ72_01840 [Adlercreutzia sp.]|nr:hypothetical protein [Adlercreutzia sp.]
MSSRTSAANKAVREAWERERQLVLNGEGTRDWSIEQQRSIVEKGKAYDFDGKAIEGHHMKSASAFPELQGEAGNIQFLTRDEHKSAHRGSFCNPTNGYYDPLSREIYDFGEACFKPCEAVRLSCPVFVEEPNDVADVADVAAKHESVPPDSSLIADTSMSEDSPRKPPEGHITENSRALLSLDGVARALIRGVKGVQAFCERHPVLVGFAKAGVAAAVYVTLERGSGGPRSGGAPFASVMQEDGSGFNRKSRIVDEVVDEAGGRVYPEERSSPQEHIVSGYDRVQNGRRVHVNSYKRGGAKED